MKIQLVEITIEEQEEIKDLIITKVKNVAHLHSTINTELIFGFVSNPKYSLVFFKFNLF